MQIINQLQAEQNGGDLKSSSISPV